MKKTVHSLAAEYLTYAAAVGDNADSIEMRYEERSIRFYDLDGHVIEVGENMKMSIARDAS